jgi:hypothetical protein
VAEGRRSSPVRPHGAAARSRHLDYSTTISQYPWDVTVHCRLMQNGDRPGDRSPILLLKAITFGNVPQRRPHSRFLTTQLLPYSASPALFRQSPGVLVIPLETRTLSSSCTTCITSVLDAAWTSMLNVARVVSAVPVCFVIRRHSRCGNTCITARSLSDLDIAFERCHNALEIRRSSFTRLILSFKTFRTRLAYRNSSQESRIPCSAQQRKLHRHPIWSEFRNPVLS